MMNLATSQFSAIDLSLSSISLIQRVIWSVLPEIYDSDHIPILMEFLTIHRSINTIPTKRELTNPKSTFFSQIVELNIENYTDQRQQSKKKSYTSLNLLQMPKI